MPAAHRRRAPGRPERQGDPPQTEDDDQCHGADPCRHLVDLTQGPQPGPQLLERVGSAHIGAGQLRSSPITTSIAAPNRKPVTTARDRNWAIQPILSTASRRNSTPTPV